MPEKSTSSVLSASARFSSGSWKRPIASNGAMAVPEVARRATNVEIWVLIFPAARRLASEGRRRVSGHDDLGGLFNSEREEQVGDEFQPAGMNSVLWLLRNAEQDQRLDGLRAMAHKARTRSDPSDAMRNFNPLAILVEQDVNCPATCIEIYCDVLHAGAKSPNCSHNGTEQPRPLRLEPALAKVLVLQGDISDFRRRRWGAHGHSWVQVVRPPVGQLITGLLDDPVSVSSIRVGSDRTV